MKHNQIFSIVLFITAIVAFAFSKGFAAPTVNRPEDFSIVYQLNSGSVPPPYYSEYTITITPTGAGEIVLVPDYAGESVPRWTETFKVEGAKLNEFFSLLTNEQAFDRKWKEPSPPRVGAPNESVQITANNRQMQIPPQVIQEQNPNKDRISKAIKALVPDQSWKSMKDKHLLYYKQRYSSAKQK